TLLVGKGMGAKLDDDLSATRRFDEPVRTLHHVLERLRGRQAREHDVRLGAHVGRRAAGNAADFLELGERAAAIAHDPVAALDQVFADRQSDLAHANEPDRFHAYPSLRLDAHSLSLERLPRAYNHHPSSAYDRRCHIVPSPALQPKSETSDFGWRDREGAGNMIERFESPPPPPSPASG